MGLVFGQGVVGGAGEGFGEVGGEELGVEILADGFGEFAGELFDVEAVFEDFEGFLEGHDRFGLAGEQEALDTGPWSPVHPSQERQAALLQQGEQPDGGKAAIQDEEVVAGKVWEPLRQEGRSASSKRPRTALSIRRDVVANSPKARANTYGWPG